MAQTCSFRTSLAQLSTIIDLDHSGDIPLRDLSINVGYLNTNFDIAVYYIVELRTSTGEFVRLLYLNFDVIVPIKQGYWLGKVKSF